jgi:hypothetical protein
MMSLAPTTHCTLPAILLSLLMMTVDCYSNGSYCYSMLPLHISPGSQTATPPITCHSGGAECPGISLTVTQNGTLAGDYSCDSEYEVTLSSNQDFIGYLIQARVPLAGETLDRFRIVGTMISAGPQGRILYCNSTSDSPNAPPLPNSATQSLITPHRSVTVIWRAPSPFTALGNIQFYATVIEDFDHFYFPLTSQVLEPLHSTCESFLPFLSLGTTAGVVTEELEKRDDWASDGIPIPGGLPFASYNHTLVYIGTNGVFSFGYRETGYWHRINNPSRFYAAPFWGDVDISDGGDIFYEIHTAPSLLIDQVSSLVSLREGIEFSATWMIVAYWREVQQFSNPTPQGNSFQGVILTDGKKSFMVCTFKNQSLDWYDSDVRIGYMGEQTHSMFGPLDNVTFLSLPYEGTVPYYNEVYQLSIDGARLSQVRPVLIGVSIIFRSDETHVTLDFDLSIDPTTCDTTQFSIQTLDGVLTFRPVYEALCEQQILFYYYTSESQDNRISFNLHPNDHILLHKTTFVRSIITSGSYSVAVSIGSSFVRTRGLTGIAPVYFIDNFIAYPEIDTDSQVHSVHFELDMTRGEFHMWLDSPVTPNISQVQLACEEYQSENTTVSGVWSTPVHSEIDSTIRHSMRISPNSFAIICNTLPCIESNYAFLQSISSLKDVFGNRISSNVFQNSFVLVNGSDILCDLQEGIQDPVDMNFTGAGTRALGMFLEVQNINSASEVLYPLLASEVYLPDCTEVEVKSIVCLRLNSTASNPLLILPESTDIFLTNTEFSTRAVFGGPLPAGLFSCSSAEDHVISAVVATGQTYLSTNDMTEVSLSLGAFWQASLTVGMCSHVSPLDIVLTDDRGSNLTGLTVSNDFQSVSVRAGPLYYEDMSDVHVHIPFNGFSNRYSSVFSISIEVPAVHAYTSGSTRGTTAVALAKELVNASMVCEVEDQYITVVWVEYGNFSTNMVVNLENTYRLLRNGHNLQIQNLNLEQFLTFNYECRVLTAPRSGHSISVANFTTVAISDLIVVSMEQQPRSNGLVAEGFRSNTVLSASALLNTEVTLPCYGALGYGRIRWHSTLLHMPGYLSEGSSSPYYSVEYSGSVGTLTLHSYSGGNLRGSLTCYSEEAGLSHPASVTIHIIDGVCSCGHSTGSPYPLSVCPESLQCSCSEGYVGDGVLCSVDSDGDGYTDIDMSDLFYCQSDTQNQLCQQDTCPHLYNPHQSRDKLNDGHPHGVAFVIDGNELPSDVIIANASVLASKTVKCLGALGNTDLSVQVYTVVQSELVTQDPAADICETEANIHQPLDSELTEGAMQCQSATTGATAWIYFTTEACVCTRPDEDILPDYILTCEEAGVEACDCSDTECMCGCGYSGDGRTCSLDTDGDGYPNSASPGLCSDRDPQNYCVQDVCPMDYDPSNDPGACHTTQDDTAGSMCVAETDSTWTIMWEDTRAGYHDTQLCQSSIPSSADYAFRLCLENGLWSQLIDTSCCKDVDVESIYEELDEILKGEFTNDTKSQLSAALADLVEATTPPDDRSSLYAQDLEITNNILKDTIDFLRNGVHNQLLDRINTELVQVIDNVLEESNNQGWDQLSNTEEGAEQLLDNAELFGLYLAEAIASPNVDVELDDGKLILNASFNNIYIAVAAQDAFGASDVVFPVAESDFSLEPMFGESLAHIKIPARLLETRANETNTTRVFAVNMVIDNINELLLVNERATEINGTNYTTRAVTNLLVSQVMAGNTRTSTTKLAIPVQLVFVTEEIVNRSRNPRCAYYDFGTSEWLEDGVTTESVTMAPDGRSYHVLCSTVHFTSFAVLVDVSGVEVQSIRLEL